MIELLLALTLQMPVIGAEVLKWNYPDALVELTRFSVCVNEDCQSVEAVRTASDDLTPAGSSSYVFELPALKLGAIHTVRVIACNKDVPEDCESESIAFRLTVKMVKPTELRVEK